MEINSLNQPLGETQPGILCVMPMPFGQGAISAAIGHYWLAAYRPPGSGHRADPYNNEARMKFTIVNSEAERREGLKALLRHIDRRARFNEAKDWRQAASGKRDPAARTGHDRDRLARGHAHGRPANAGERLPQDSCGNHRGRSVNRAGPIASQRRCTRRRATRSRPHTDCSGARNGSAGRPLRPRVRA